jgi:hypothetical protein
MWLNDNEKEQMNWKNSEVMRLFVDNYLEPKKASFKLEDLDEATKESIRDYYRNLTDEELANHIFRLENQMVMQMEPPSPNLILAREVQGQERKAENDCGDGAMPVDKVLVVKQNLQTELDGVINKLSALSSQYGNEKVRYMMEHAVDQLKSIYDNGE